MKKQDSSSWGYVWRHTLTAMSLGWDLALPIFGGVFIGQWLDRQLGTGHIFTLGLLVLGIGIGYYNLARFIQRTRQNDQQQAVQDKNDGNE